MNISISLTPELVSMIEARVKGGRYSSASEVVQEALRLLEQMDHWEIEQIEHLRATWNDGIASGDGGELDFAELKLQHDANGRLQTNGRNLNSLPN